MNTTEKRKLETILVSKLQDQRDAFKVRRQSQHDELVETHTKNVPKEVTTLCAKRNKLNAEHKLALEKLTSERRDQNKLIDDKFRALETALTEQYTSECETLTASAINLGYEFEKSYEDKQPYSVSLRNTYKINSGSYHRYAYTIPAIQKFQEETDARLQAFKDLETNYVIAVYADNDEMPKVMANFQKELKTLSA